MVLPEPLGGMEKFYEAILNELEYPASLDKEGRVFIRFTVDTTGHMKNFEVIRGFNELADTEAIRVLKKIDFPFIPGKKDNAPWETQLVIPVIFKLKEK